MQPGDVLLLAIGQGLLAATPLQLAVGYSTFANGGTVVTPHVVQAILAPETPDSGIPGVADMAQAKVVQQITPAGRAIPMPPEVHDPIQHGIRRNITGPGAERPLDDGRGAVRRLPGRRHPGRRQDGHRAGPRQLPVERLVGVHRLQHRPRPPVHGDVVPGEGGLRLGRRGAGREVHVRGPVGRPAARPGRAVRAARHHLGQGGQGPPEGRRRLHGEHATPTRSRPAWRRAPRTDDRMGLSMLQRKPDSGLGNIRSSPADPSRNIDWVLLLAQLVLTVAGCFIVFSATRTRTADPYTFVTRQVIFAIVAAVAMVIVMLFDYEWWKQRARTLYVLTVIALFGMAVYSRASGHHDAGRRRRPDPDPTGRVRQVRRAAGDVRLPQRGPHAGRGRQLPPVPRFADHRRLAGRADHRPARPRHRLGADRHDDGRAARRRRQGPLHRHDQPDVGGHRRPPPTSPASSTTTSWPASASSSTRTTPTCRRTSTRSTTR